MQNGWVYEPQISSYESLLFYNAIRCHKDRFCYTPIALAKREQTGMKYRYLCIACPFSSQGLFSHFTVIEIYKSLLGKPYITRLNRFNFNHLQF